MCNLYKKKETHTTEMWNYVILIVNEIILSIIIISIFKQKEQTLNGNYHDLDSLKFEVTHNKSWWHKKISSCKHT